MCRDNDDDDDDDDLGLHRYQDNRKAFVYLLDLLFTFFFRKYSDLHKYKIRYLSNKYSMYTYMCILYVLYGS